jgi:DeoR family glycerol-3-phosphate regulon repressor
VSDSPDPADARARNPRQQGILEIVRSSGTVRVEALAKQLGVTVQTVRRDLTRLADDGLLNRYHGGVQPAPSTTENIAYRQRQALHREAKRRIAKAVAREIPDGCSLSMTIGTTIEAIAEQLLDRRNLRIITNNLNVAATLADNPHCEVIVAGGVVRARDRAIVGEAALQFINQFKVDIGLIGISSIEADGSLRDFDYREVSVARGILEHSRAVWLAADHSKFHRSAMVEVGRLDQVDRLFTDQPPPRPFVSLLATAGVDCVLASGELT